MKKSELETLISNKSQEILKQMAKELKENYIDNPDKSKSDEFAYLQLNYPIEVSKRLIYSVLSECSTNFVVMTVTAIFSAIFIYFLKVIPPIYKFI